MNKPINWDEVKVGETEIVNPSVGRRFLVVGMHDELVWLYCREHRDYHWRHMGGLDLWTIDDPWEEITGSVTFAPYEIGFYVVHYDGRPIAYNDRHFKVDLCRVWKRKEGRE